jgi:hypothetical protein
VTQRRRELSAAFTPIQREKRKRAWRFTRRLFLDIEAA